MKWKERFIKSGKSTLVQRRNTDSRDRENEDLKKIIGDQRLMIDAFLKNDP